MTGRFTDLVRSSSCHLLERISDLFLDLLLYRTQRPYLVLTERLPFCVGNARYDRTLRQNDRDWCWQTFLVDVIPQWWSLVFVHSWSEFNSYFSFQREKKQHNFLKKDIDSVQTRAWLLRDIAQLVFKNKQKNKKLSTRDEQRITGEFSSRRVTGSRLVRRSRPRGVAPTTRQIYTSPE